MFITDRILRLLAATALAVPLASVGDTWNEPEFRVEGTTAFLSGMVAQGQLASLKAAGPSLSQVVLDSAGGDAVAAIAIAREVRQRGLVTYVGPHGQCVSACTIIFQAGTVRVVHPQVFFGYHAPRLHDEGRSSTKKSDAGVEQLRTRFHDVYLELGVPESTIQEFWHPHVMFYYSADELLRRNIATVISDIRFADL